MYFKIKINVNGKNYLEHPIMADMPSHIIGPIDRLLEDNVSQEAEIKINLIWVILDDDNMQSHAQVVKCWNLDSDEKGMLGLDKVLSHLQGHCKDQPYQLIHKQSGKTVQQ